MVLMAIVAHPDDEAFGMGGTLTKYGHAGVEVHLVMATLGEQGQIANPNLHTDQPINVIRERELRSACTCYGIENLHLLGYLDGQTTIVPQNQAVHKIVKLIREVKPQVVISFGPDGVYGHYDHLAVHRWATAAVYIAAQANYWPEAGVPHTVSKFYHRALAAAQVAHFTELNGRDFVLMDGIPFPFVGHPPERITTIIDVSEQWPSKLRAIRCHASQLHPDMAYLQPDFDVSAYPWLKQETFILAQHTLETPPAFPEDDLFAGLC